jgi:hypothetical protein
MFFHHLIMIIICCMYPENFTTCITQYDFQYVGFIFPQTFNSLVWGLFNDEIDLW